MPFTAPSWVPALPPIPDSISIETFMFNEKHGRWPLGYSRPPFTCGLSGKTYGAREVRQRVDYLARALCEEFGFKPDQGSEWDKVIAVFSLNTIDYLTLAWAVHRIGGVLTAVNAAYNEHELAYQLKDSGAKAIFTCAPLLNTCVAGVKKSNLSEDKTYLLPVPEHLTGGAPKTSHKSVDDLINRGKQLPEIVRNDKSWPKGHAKERCAFLCYSSGTSGLPKGVMISHYNVIANTLQVNAHDSLEREELRKKISNAHYTESVLGLLPMSHIYGLVVVCHVGIYRGDGVIVLPKYDFKTLLQTIQDYKISLLYLVPPMIIQITKQNTISKQYDLSSVRAAFTGAAPLGKETANDLNELYPDWAVKQGYGLTETCTVVSGTSKHDICLGTSGSALCGITLKLMTPEGKEITTYNEPGELWVKSPSVVLGYHNNAKATEETFVTIEDGRYMRTGDEAIITLSPKGNEHLTITDRIKELIKVKGHQVAPAELEAHLLTHPAVLDCVVIGVPSDREGEVPKAFVVKAPGAIEDSDRVIKRLIAKHVEQHKTNYKWLRGGIEFIDVVPKSPSGKILRRLLRDQEREKSRKAGAKL